MAIALAATGLVVLAVVVLLVSRGPSGGAATREEAVASYVDALNRNDEATLRRISGYEGSALEAGIRRRLTEHGGRGIRLTDQQILDGVAPYHSYAVLTGAKVGQDGRDEAYSERLYQRGDDGRWYVDLREPVSPSVSPPLPPAGATPPT